jgi:hypothetical protein
MGTVFTSGPVPRMMAIGATERHERGLSIF